MLLPVLKDVFFLQVLRKAQEAVAMGLMGLGGLVAVLGGMLFLVLALRAIHAGWRGFAAGSPQV